MSDLIKRQDAIKAVWECYKMVAERDIPQNVDLAMVDAMQATLSVIPSADRPQGEWIDKAISIIDDMQREDIIDYAQAWEFRMRARMKGADDGRNAD